MAVVSSSFAATGQSASFQPTIRERSWGQFNITLSGAGTATIQLERSLDGGSTWAAIYAAGVQLYVWSYTGTNIAEVAEENERGALYRLNCTVWTSAVSYRISQ